MKINIATPGVSISEGLTHLIRARFSRLERMFTGIIGCEITLSKVSDKQHHNYAMEASLVTPVMKFWDLERADSFEVALAQLIDNLYSKLKKHEAELAAAPVT